MQAAAVLKENGGTDYLRYLRLAGWFCALFVVAGAARFAGAWHLLNLDGDANAYVESVEYMRARLADGTFTAKELFGFWMPLFQFLAALLSMVTGKPYVTAKLLAAFCGAMVCLLVYLLTLRLTGRRGPALLGFAVIALNPLHTLHSTSSLTDIPHAMFVMGSLYFALRRRWVAAAACVAAGSLMRIESWMFILLLPALQFLVERRVSPVACALMLFSPIFWLYVSHAATGNALEYFHARDAYIRATLAENPHLTTFTAERVLHDISRLTSAANSVIVAACGAGAVVLLRRLAAQAGAWRRGTPPAEAWFAPAAAALYYFANLGFLAAAYATNKQPDLWDRYGLILFSLGLPLALWTLQTLAAARPRLAPLLTGVFLLACLSQFAEQARGGWAFITSKNPKPEMAERLRALHEEAGEMRVFCDDEGLRVVSGLPPGTFFESSNAPAERQAFIAHLREHRIGYLVYVEKPLSTPCKILPELKEGKGDDLFHLIAAVPAPEGYEPLYLYRVTAVP